MTGLIEILVGPITSLLDKWIPDKSAREKMAHDIATLVETQAHAQIMAQMEVNKVQAQHGSKFVAGARPGAMWVCVAAMAWHYVLQPLLLWCVWLFPEYADKIATAPKLDVGDLMWLLAGMLGLGGMRSFEKRHGVARSAIDDTGQ